MEIIPARTFNLLYVYQDSAWLLILLVIFLIKKRYLAIIAGLIGGMVYFIVDYGIFYLALGTRTVEGASPAILLLWLSMSYGFTNFAWIWLWLDRDSYAVEWSLLMILGWFTTALLSQNFGSAFQVISISRGTSGYHGVMALILLVGYGILIIKNIKAVNTAHIYNVQDINNQQSSVDDKRIQNGNVSGDNIKRRFLKNNNNKIRDLSNNISSGNNTPGKKINILWILAIGILVQFSWEAILLIAGIRPIGIMPLLVNSLLETNLGLPYMFLIHCAISKRFNEDLSKV
jgi:hypothetical protein